MEKKNNNKQRHRKFDAQFKQEALKQVENGRSVSTVAQAWVLVRHCYINGESAQPSIPHLMKIQRLNFYASN